MKSVVKLVVCAVILAGLTLTPFSPIKAYRNVKTFMDINKNIEGYSGIIEQTNQVKKNFESQRSAGTPALFEPSTAVEKISAIEGVTVQEVSVLQNSGSTVKNIGKYSESINKEDIDALQFIVTVSDLNAFLTAFDSLQYLVETIKVSPSEKTIILNINFSGGLNND